MSAEIKINEILAKEYIEFLKDLAHGPCASVRSEEYEKYREENAEKRLKAIAEIKLGAAGAYGRTIDRWWNGIYTNRKPPTVYETIDMSVDEITKIIIEGSRRG